MKADAATPTAHLVKQGVRFARDFAAFANGDGVRGAALAGLAAAFEGVGLMLLVPLLSIVTSSNDDSGWIRQTVVRLLDGVGAETRTARLSLLLAIFVTLVVVRAVVVARRDLMLARLQTGFIEQIRVRVARSLAMAPWQIVSRLQHARVTHLMSGDIQRIASVTNFFVQFLAMLVVILFQIGVALLLAPALSAIALALIAIGAVGGFLALARAREFGAQLTRMGIALMHETTQFLGGLKLAAGQNRQTDFIDEFERSVAALKQQQIAFIRQQMSVRFLASVITGLVGALVAFVGLIVLHTPAAVLIAMLLLFARLSGPVMQVSQAVQQFAHALPAFEEVCQLEQELSATQVLRPCHGAGLIGQGAIVFRDVNFHYQQTKPSEPGAVTGLDLTIAPGSFVGVTGPTGAGKTTFADLLVGLLEPQSGEIAIGGTPLRGPAAVMWREHVSYVAQDPYLFRDTIRRNLLWARPQASERELWDALAIAGADRQVRRLESGLDTMLGERGGLISGGERQRLCLARAVLRQPWLYVLDEATSAIDVAGEREILERLARLDPRPTIVMIAHRNESLALCDRILRFQSGTCVTDALAAPDLAAT